MKGAAVAQAPEELILGRYRPIETAGEGGFGTVVAAWDTRIQRRVAVKIMPVDGRALDANVESPSSLLADDAALDAASVPGLTEARTAALLSDPHIAGVLDFEVQGDCAYLIMEYVDGLTLAQLMRDASPEITPDVVAAVFHDVAQALEVAHANQVLHLDIKPDNVLINHQGQVKVTDFGLAELSSAAGYAQAEGGTIGYMPIEQMRREPLDERCDEWAFASLTYEMIADENPFVAKDLKRAEGAIRNAELVLPSLCMPGIDSRADDAIFRALDPDRDERFETVADFADALQPCLGSITAGRKQLKTLVQRICADDEEELETEGADRFRFAPVPPAEAVVRLWCAASAGVLAAACTPAIAVLPGSPEWLAPVLAAAATILALFVPHAGALASTALLGVALFANGSPLAGSVMLGAAAVWWYFSGRYGIVQAASAFGVVLLGLAGASCFAALASGYALRAKYAAANAAFAFLVALMLAGLSAAPLGFWRMGAHGIDVNAALLGLLGRPGTWIALVAWVLAALVFAGCCARRSRVASAAGALAAGALLVCAAVPDWVVGGFQGLPTFYPGFVPAVAAAVAAVVAAALYVPARQPLYEDELAQDLYQLGDGADV
jgi:hypothetical protein